MSEPTQTCKLCGRSVTVVIGDRGFPADNAEYRSGIIIGGRPTGMNQ